MEWVQDNPWAVWLAIAVLLAVIEMFSLELVLLMFAIGAGCAAIASGAGAPIWAAVAVFALVSVALLFLVRPPLVARMHAGPTLQQGHEAQVGRTAVVLEPVDQRTGRVQLAGELWSARSASPAETFPEGTEVQVLRIEGATAVVTASAAATTPTTGQEA